MKGAKVKPFEGPHERRFTLSKDFRITEKDKSAVNMEKSMPRSPNLFAEAQHFPVYDYSI
jgi:hypothetical protein